MADFILAIGHRCLITDIYITIYVVMEDSGLVIDSWVRGSHFPSLLVSNYCVNYEELLCQCKERDPREGDSQALFITSRPNLEA